MSLMWASGSHVLAAAMGAVIGCCVALMVIAMCIAASSADIRSERMREANQPKPDDELASWVSDN